MNTQNTTTHFSVGTSYLIGDSLNAFLSALVQANLQPILQANVPAPATVIVKPSVLAGDELNDFLASLRPQIERIAASIYYGRYYSISIALDDLIQVGLIGAWRCTQKYDASKMKRDKSLLAYCLRRARGEMINHVKTQFRTPAQSLDAYLAPDTDTGYTHQIADTAQSAPTSNVKRRRILAALRKLTTRERTVIMAAYGIDGTNGKSPLPEELSVSESAYYSARTRATRKLAHILQ